MHISFDIPAAIVCIEKKEYDLFMEIYTESLDLMDKVLNETGFSMPTSSFQKSNAEGENSSMFYSAVDGENLVPNT
eukprot:UN18275